MEVLGSEVKSGRELAPPPEQLACVTCATERQARLQTTFPSRPRAGADALPPGVPRVEKEPSGLETDRTSFRRRRYRRRGCCRHWREAVAATPCRSRRPPCPPRRRCGPCWTSSWARPGTVSRGGRPGEGWGGSDARPPGGLRRGPRPSAPARAPSPPPRADRGRRAFV